MANITIIHTSNPANVHELSWTVDNFGMTPSVIRSPAFSPFPGCLDTFCLEIEYEAINQILSPNYLRVFLIKCNCTNNSFMLSCNVSMPTSRPGVLFQRETFLENVEEKNELIATDVLYSKKGFSRKCLREDKLVVNVTLKFSGYNVKSSISSNFEGKPMADHEELIKDFRSMYKSGLACDVTFSMDGQTLHAHKAVICSRSPVFATMFSLDMQEKNSNTVCIQGGVSAHVFDCFLLYLYTSTIEDKESDTVFVLYSLACQYDVESLRKECSRLLSSRLTVECACNVLELADLHEDRDLKEAAKTFLLENICQVVGQVQWAELISTKPHLVEEVMGPIQNVFSQRSFIRDQC